MTDTTRTDDGHVSSHSHELNRLIGPRLLLLFIVGDMLGVGVYALTGQVAGLVGGAAWLPFLVAFAVAAVTAMSYLELVTKYPQAAGAALYVHKAFGIHFLTFLVCFTVMCSGITSASAASRAFAPNLLTGFNLQVGNAGIMLVALGFIALLMAINLRGVSESVKLNVGLTLIEFSGLLLVIFVSLSFVVGGEPDFSRVVAFEAPGDKNAFLAVSTATALAFFALIGFEDSVNMAEETKDPTRIFPKVMLTGVTIGVVVYVVISVLAVAVVPVGELAGNDTPLVTVVQTAAPDFPINRVLPFISMVAVANGALLNMLMASRLLYGMSKQEVLPPVLSWVSPRRRTPWVGIVFTTALAMGLISYVSLNPQGQQVIALFGGTTTLLLLAVFAVVNVSVLVLRRDTTDTSHFNAGPVCPSSAPSRASTSCCPGPPADRQRSTRSPACCSRPGSCCGRSPGSRTGHCTPSAPSSMTPPTWRGDARSRHRAEPRGAFSTDRDDSSRDLAPHNGSRCSIVTPYCSVNRWAINQR